MNLLLDTHLLLWIAGAPGQLSDSARTLIEDQNNNLFFSVVSLWEISIKSGLGRADFQADARVLRRGLMDNGYQELAITGEHAVYVQSLPPLHKDPFDRMLISQSAVEGFVLLTSDELVSQYQGAIQKV